MRLFRSLFAGRDDVHALRWENALPDGTTGERRKEVMIVNHDHDVELLISELGVIGGDTRHGLSVRAIAKQFQDDLS